MRKQTFPVLIIAALAWAQWQASVWASPQATSAPQKTASSPAHPATPQKSSASLLDPASLKLQAPAVFDAKFTTTKGDFVVRVTRAWSPRGADRFYNLVKYHFFDGAAFFRVIEGFVVQFGISARPEVSQRLGKRQLSPMIPSRKATRAGRSLSPPPVLTLAPPSCSSTWVTTRISTAWDSLPLAKSRVAWKWSTSSIASTARARPTVTVLTRTGFKTREKRTWKNLFPCLIPSRPR